MGAFLVWVLSLAVVAQATMVGEVRDALTGLPVPGAAVVLVDLERSAVTDTSGGYVLTGVPPGPQHVTVRRVGYASRTIHAFVPETGTLEIDLVLDPEPVQLGTVQVEAPVPMRGLDESGAPPFPDRSVSAGAIRAHPLAAEPDGFQALGGGEVALRPETPSGVSVRGAASDQTAYLLDGMPVFSPYHVAGLFSAWNPDALSTLELSSARIRIDEPPALAGAITGRVRAPGERFAARGSISTTQSRVTASGPLGALDAGYVVSWRAGYPGLLAPPDEPTYVQGETGDQLAKLELPAFGGRLRLLAYDAENELDAAAEVPPSEGPGAGVTPPRNLYEWSSRSFGAAWQRPVGTAALRIEGWRANADASAVWRSVSAGNETLASTRRDWGAVAVLERGSSASPLLGAALGVRVERSETDYGVRSDSVALVPWGLAGVTPVTTAFVRYGTAVGPDVELAGGLSLAAAAGALHPAPRLEARWLAQHGVTLHGGYARTHQFCQSLRNAESVVGNVFPADLYVGVGDGSEDAAVPVARADLGVLGVEARPSSGLRVGVQVYERSARGLVLVAPREGDPYASGAFAVGSSSARGLALDAAWSRTRYGVSASYSLQHVRLAYGDSSYTPDPAAAHAFEGGVIVYTSATLSLRLGAMAAFGRRTTTALGQLEWEAHNLLDQGSEFGGSPWYSGQGLGATELPAYYRLDLGVRKHWHVRLGGRETVLELFGTATNLLGRKNLLTYVRDPATGIVTGVEMRPRAPLVIGLDWRL